MENNLLKIFVSLGVPGLALGVFYMLFKSFKWDFPQVPSVWVGPIIIFFMLLTSSIVFYVLTLWAPKKNHDNKIDPPSTQIVSSKQKNYGIKEINAMSFLIGWYSRQSLLPETAQKKMIFSKIDGYLRNLSIKLEKSSQYYLENVEIDGGIRSQEFTEKVYGQLISIQGENTALYFGVAQNFALLAAAEQDAIKKGNQIRSDKYAEVDELLKYIELPDSLKSNPHNLLVEWYNSLKDYFETRL